MTANPLPKAIVQRAIHASEGVSIFFSYASREDSNCNLYKNLPMFLISLLALETAVNDYKTILEKYNNYSDVKLDLPNDGKPCSETMNSLFDAVDQALERIMYVYFDVIKSFPLPHVYSARVSDRLQRVESS